MLEHLANMIDERCKWNKLSEEDKRNLADKKERKLKIAKQDFEKVTVDVFLFCMAKCKAE